MRTSTRTYSQDAAHAGNAYRSYVPEYPRVMLVLVPVTHGGGLGPLANGVGLTDAETVADT